MSNDLRTITALTAAIEQLTETRDEMQKRHDATLAALAELNRNPVQDALTACLEPIYEALADITKRLLRR